VCVLCVFRPGDGSSSATNVVLHLVLLLVLILVVGNPKALLLHKRSSPNFAHS